MRTLISIFVFVATTTAMADSIAFDLGKRAKKFIPSYVKECQEVLKQDIAADLPNVKGELTYTLTDVDENIMSKYLWWSVTDQSGNVVMSVLMQKPAGGKCF